MSRRVRAPGPDTRIETFALLHGYFGAFAENPQSFYGVQVTLAVTTSLQTNTGFADPAAGQIQQALTDSIQTYEHLDDVLSDIVIILTDRRAQEDPKYVATTIRPPWPTGACQIVLYSPWSTFNDTFRRQALAHELYHCVQQTMTENSNAAYAYGSNWWGEGSAAYFSNVVYPTYNLEWLNLDYSPDEPIYNARDPYSANLFFQVLRNSFGASYVNKWVISQTFTSSPAEERTRLSKLADFSDNFHLFAQKFSLDDIYDTGGKHMPILKPVQLEYPNVVTTSDTEGREGTIPLVVDTFTVSEFESILGPAQTIVISYNAANAANVRVSYALYGTNFWTPMPKGPIGGPVGTVTIRCNYGSPTPIFILVTSTNDTDKVAVTVSLTQFYANTCLECVPGTQTLTGCTQANPIAITVPFSFPTATPSSSPSTSSSSSSPSSSSPSSSPSSRATNTTGSCTAVFSLNQDPCLIGPTWNLNLANTKSLILQRLASSDPDATINSLALSGSGTVEIQNTNATFQYTDLTIDLDMTVEGIDVPTNTVVDGAMEANLYVQSGGDGSGAFCLDVYEGDGTVVETDPITGGFTLDLGADWVPATENIQYTCTSGSLTMQGSSSVAGDLGWGPYVYTS